MTATKKAGHDGTERFAAMPDHHCDGNWIVYTRATRRQVCSQTSYEDAILACRMLERDTPHFAAR